MDIGGLTMNEQMRELSTEELNLVTGGQGGTLTSSGGYTSGSGGQFGSGGYAPEGGQYGSGGYTAPGNGTMGSGG
jgi:bacteriocin-like protein